MALGAAISGGANTAYQIQKGEPFSYSDAFIATVVGAATQGKGLWVTQAAGVGGSLTGSVIKGEDPIPPEVGSVAGTTLGFYGGPVISNMLKPIVPESTSSVLGNMGGSYGSEVLSDCIQNVVGKK